jgi:hypothetical protein
MCRISKLDKKIFLANLALIAVFLFLGSQVAQAAVLGLGIGSSRISKEVTSFKDMRTSNVVTQSLDYSCGPAALATLLSYYFEDKVTEKEIIGFLLLTGNLAKIKSNKGFSLLDLKNFARYKGYEVVGYKMDLEFLAKLNKPVLIPINIKEYSHFVIFRGSKGNRVFLADPALGKMTMLIDKFLKIWQGGIGLVLAKRGEENLHSPLKLSNDEEAVVAGANQPRNLLGIDLLGNIYSQGEF